MELEKAKTRWFAYLVFMIIFLCTVPPIQASAKTPPAEKAAIASDPFEIRLITFSPYDDIFTWFGHSALEVRNKQTGKAYTYNFGGFFFGIENLLEFTFGRFTFWSFAVETERALAPYQAENRHMVFQSLDLDRKQKRLVIRELVNALKPGNRFYQYDHFRNNCSTQLRDIIDRALEGQLKKQSTGTADLTYKEYIHRMTYHNPVLDFLLTFLLNDNLDQPISDWDSMFLPDRMMVVIQQVKKGNAAGLEDHPLVAERTELNVDPLNEFYLPKAIVPNTRGREYLIGTILLFLFAIAAILYLGAPSKRQKFLPVLTSVFGMTFGVLGLGLFFMMCFTEHQDTYWNENILLLNPLTFLLFPVGILRIFDRSQALFRWLCLLNGTTGFLALFLKLLPTFDQVNAQQIRILLPVLITLGIVGMIDIKRQKSLSKHNP